MEGRENLNFALLRPINPPSSSNAKSTSSITRPTISALGNNPCIRMRCILALRLGLPSLKLAAILRPRTFRFSPQLRLVKKFDSTQVGECGVTNNIA